MQLASSGTRPPTHPSGVALASPEPGEDPRLTHFARFLRAVDRGDFRAGTAATRALQELGVAVVLIKPRRTSGGRHGA